MIFQHRTASGFSLLEMLVVLAILSVLFLAFRPALARREGGRNAALELLSSAVRRSRASAVAGGRERERTFHIFQGADADLVSGGGLVLPLPPRWRLVAPSAPLAGKPLLLGESIVFREGDGVAPEADLTVALSDGTDSVAVRLPRLNAAAQRFRLVGTEWIPVD